MSYITFRIRWMSNPLVPPYKPHMYQLSLSSFHVQTHLEFRRYDAAVQVGLETDESFQEIELYRTFVVLLAHSSRGCTLKRGFVWTLHLCQEVGGV